MRRVEGALRHNTGDVMDASGGNYLVSPSCNTGMNRVHYSYSYVITAAAAAAAAAVKKKCCRLDRIGGAVYVVIRCALVAVVRLREKLNPQIRM